MNRTQRTTCLLWLLLLTVVVKAAEIKGLVVDAQTKEPLIGATVQIDGTTLATATDIDGKFSFTSLSAARTYTLYIKYIAYKTKRVDGVHASEQAQEMVIALDPDEQTLGEVTVTGVARQNTETAMVQMAKSSAVIVNNISAQEISKSQDNNAGEVIRRVPGVSIIDDKFVMVRGLSQRYNNVWINGGAVPSSEADSRAFSFDIIPSGQIDNMVIVKTPSPEYPADYSGGFIVINTKEIPTENTFNISVGGNYNDCTQGRDFLYAQGSATDFLGFDNGKRGINGGIHAPLTPIAGNGIDLQGNGFNNDWMVKQRSPLPDLKLSANLSHRWNLDGHTLGLLASMNYSNEWRTYGGMLNNLFGVYDVTNDRSNYLRHSVDDQYNHNARVGAMLNLTFLSSSGNHKYQLKNIFNQIGNDRYTFRRGVTAQSNNEESAEYYYRSRTTYNGQMTGKHTLGGDALDWSVGYAYANRRLPDRRRYAIDDALDAGVLALTTGNEINREFTQLDEHIFSLSVNEKHDFDFGGFQPSLKLGAYGEYRTRKYNTREFIYNWNVADNNLPEDFRYGDIPTLLSNADHFGADKLYLLEELNMTNDYEGNNQLGAGYLAATLPWGRLDVYAGLRFEHSKMELVSNLRDYEVSHHSRYYTYNDLFPSVNMNYKFNESHQLRLSYGKSVNRPEFREVSSSVYYDFDLASNVKGNTELTPCYIHNIDLRYEFYPSRGEQISLAGFFKYFDSPIEWTYTVAGGTDLIYSYKNAKSARNLGVELDIRKTLDFIGLPQFSLSFNGALIHSRVQFAKGSKEQDRPMQGQSPYLINAGLFYKNEQQQLNVSLLYNRIGKRIIGVGRSEGTTGSDENARVPDSYEMPRDMLDLTASKRFGKHLELKASVRDVLAQRVSYKQFAEVVYADGTSREVQQITRQYKPGRNISFTATYTF